MSAPVTYREARELFNRLRRAAAALRLAGQGEWDRRVDAIPPKKRDKLWDADVERQRPWAKHVVRVVETLEVRKKEADDLLHRGDVLETLRVRPRETKVEVARSSFYNYHTYGSEQRYAREELKPMEAEVPRDEVERVGEDAEDGFGDGFVLYAACEPWEAEALVRKMSIIELLQCYGPATNVLVLHPGLRMLKDMGRSLIAEAGRLV